MLCVNPPLFGHFAWFSHLDPEFCMAFLILPGVFPRLSYFFPAFCLSCLVSLCFASLVFSCPDVTPILSQPVYFLSTCLILSLTSRDFNTCCAWNLFPITDTINYDRSFYIKLTDDYCRELYRYCMTAYSLSCRFRHNAEFLYKSVRWHRTFSWACLTFTFRRVRKIAKSDY